MDARHETDPPVRPPSAGTSDSAVGDQDRRRFSAALDVTATALLALMDEQMRSAADTWTLLGALQEKKILRTHRLALMTDGASAQVQRWAPHRAMTHQT